jgi:hypothetical protein
METAGFDGEEMDYPSLRLYSVYKLVLDLISSIYTWLLLLTAIGFFVLLKLQNADGILAHNVRSGIIFEELFEGTSPFSQALVIDKGVAAAHSRTYVASPAFQGSKAVRFELRESDPEYASGTRTEVAFRDAAAKDQWYSFAAYFPASEWGHDNAPEIIAQWHSWPDAHLGEQWQSPTTKMLVFRDRLRFDVGYNTNQVSRGFEAEKFFDLGQVPKDSWQEFVIHIVHSPFSDGLVEVWQNGKKVVDHKGGNSHNDARLPFLKVGLYKWDWNGTQKTDVSRRVLYMDNVRIGNAQASFASMSSKNSSSFFYFSPVLSHLNSSLNE